MPLLRFLAGLLVVAAPCVAAADDWLRFRGPNGSGIAASEKMPPAEWASDKNVKWSVDLPGPGHSCPIVVGDKVILTYWTGYGLQREQPGEQSALRLHIICLNRSTGATLWDQEIQPQLPEEQYGGMFAEHGYASHTPVSDGEKVYCFFGKSGVHAFDLEGKQLWSHEVGDGLDPRRWGSASSLILVNDVLVVTAGPESGSLFGLNKHDGTQIWKQEVGLSGMWGTPITSQVDQSRTDLVLAVPDEIWGMNPENGKLRWFADGISGDQMNGSPIEVDGVIYAMDGRSGEAVAVRAGGKGDVNDSHLVWRENHRARISTPIHYQGRLYWVASGVLNCIDAKTGSQVYQERLATGNAAGQDRRGRRGGQDYSSPVVAGNRLYFFNRQGVGSVVELSDKFKLLASNTLDGDNGDFTATPAIADGQLFVRTTNRIYCIAE